MAIDDVSRSLVLNCRQIALCRKLRTDDKYERISRFLHTFLIRNFATRKLFLSKPSVLFLLDMMCVYGTAAAANGKTLETEVVGIQDKSLQLEGGPLALSFFDQRHIDLLE